MVQALAGIRILDLSWGIAGPLGVLLLAEHGADVIKVEPPGGDPFRSYDGYTVWNRSRRSIELDLKSSDGTTTFRELIASADVIVESFRPGVMTRLGFGYQEIATINPRAILCSIPAYPEGHRYAPRPGYDALVQASSGQMWEQPGWRMGPIFLHMPMPSMGTAYLVPLGILSALHARETTGRGQHVTTSLFQGALLYTTQIWQDIEHATSQFHELMGKSYPPGIHQQMIFECANRQYLHLSVMSGLTPLKTQDAILELDDAPDPFTFMAMSAEDREIINAKRRAKFLTWDRDALVAEFRANNHAVEPIIEAGEIFDHPQTIANGLVATVIDSVHGSTTQMGVPIHLLGTPGMIQGPQPTVGQHNAEIRAELAAARASTTATVAAQSITQSVAQPITQSVTPSVAGLVATAASVSPRDRGPLADITICDFGQYLAGPFGPMLLSDLGANVIKIEPVTGDAMRMASKPFFGCQRGKRSLALNIKDPAGREIAHELIAQSDIVHHNMTRGVATKLGIDYAAAKQQRGDIIYCNTYAYGLPDPLGRFGGLDPLYQASGGLEFEAGAVAAGNHPLYYRFGMCDASNALLSIVGVLTALRHRDKTGEGQELWTSLHDGGVIYSSDTWLGADGTVHQRPRLDADFNGIDALYRLYRTQDHDWIMIAVTKDAEWQALCGALGLTDLSMDPRFATAHSRSEHRRQIESLLEPAFLLHTARFWSRTFDDLRIPNEIPFDSFDGRRVLHDADNQRLGLVSQYDHAIFGSMRQFGSLINLSETQSRVVGPPPLVGQHSREILEEFNIDTPIIDALIASGAVYQADATLDDYRTRFTN